MGLEAIPLHDVALAANDVWKSFDATVALRGCAFEVRRGEVHGLIGANGAGKSTLVKILSGAIAPDEGSLAIGEWSGADLTPRRAQELGVATIYQDPDLVPTLAAPENIALGRERRVGRAFVDRRAERADARGICGRVGLSGSALQRPVGELSRADQQLVEIAKALHRDARVILMDEPTAPLGPSDANRLLDLIRELAVVGVAVVYITHRLGEALAICDRITVMRDGVRVWTRPADELSKRDIVQGMTGHSLISVGDTSMVELGEPVLEARGLGQGERLAGIDLTLHAGEIVGIGGLIGAGRSRLLRVLGGAEGYDQGEIELHGKVYRPTSPADAIRTGVGLIPEDRKSEGLFMDMAMESNLSFVKPPSSGGLIRHRRERATAKRWLESLGIRPAAPSRPVNTFSGGNQQKILIGRWLHAGVEVLLVDEPGQGVDVSGKEDIYRILRSSAAEGKAIAVVSSESEELFALADRLIVMRQGRFLGEYARGQLTEHEFIGLASGAEGEKT